MTEPTENTDTHALLEKSQVVHQTSRGPTVEEVAAQLLRQALEAWLRDAAASEAYAEIRAHARAQGNAIAPADGYIAATAASHGLMVATRDTGPFVAAGLTVFNPWTAKH